MPSRRTLLAGAAAAGASTLAGCGALSGDSLDHVVQSGDPAVPDGATVVAGDESLVEASPHGAFAQRAVAFEHRDRLFVDTDLQLVPGENQFGTDWRLAGFTNEHDYGALDPDPDAVVRLDASYGPAEPGQPTVVRMDAGRADDTLSRWTVEYDDNGSTWGPSFRTELPTGGTLADGDTVAEGRLVVRVRKSPLGRETFELETGLRYGEDGR